MAKRQAISKPQNGPQSFVAQGRSTSALKGRSAISGAKKPDVKPHETTAHQVRRSARLAVNSQPAGGSSNQQLWTGTILVNQASADHQPNSSQRPNLKRKRAKEAPRSVSQAQETLFPRQSRLEEGRRPKETTPHVSKAVVDPVQSWVLNETWPSEYLTSEDPAQQLSLSYQSVSEEIMAAPFLPTVQYADLNGFKYPLPIKKLPTSLRRKQSDSSLTESSRQKSREGKSTPYRNARYKTLLETKGSFMHDFDDEPPSSFTNLAKHLLDAEQAVPQNSLFRDDIFRRFCREMEDRNEAMIVQDISRLLVPSAKNLAIYGDEPLDILMENVNEPWTESIPVEGPRPQPDYCLGFKRTAFTTEQLHKLDPLIGSVFDTSYFVASYQMYFPFLTCEVKCGAAALDIADRQNAHSMTIAVRSVVELYKAVKRQQELDREILAFSVSHDHRSVRLYGHYAVVDRDNVRYYRHPIREFSFVEMNGRDKWTTYRFVKNIYDLWMPRHLGRICSAIDQLPSTLDFHVNNEPTGDSELGTRGVIDNDPGLQGEGPNLVPQTITPDTSMSNEPSRWTAKRVKTTGIVPDAVGR